MNSKNPGVLLCKDLLWLSRITTTAKELGLSLIAVRSMEQLEKALRQQVPACLLVDLDTAQPQQVREVLAATQTESIPTVAFGAHVAHAELDAARATGFTRVLPRSKMAGSLEEVLLDCFQAE